jgi:hypothetical protein
VLRRPLAGHWLHRDATNGIHRVEPPASQAAGAEPFPVAGWLIGTPVLVREEQFSVVFAHPKVEVRQVRWDQAQTRLAENGPS